ncbi:MAG: hypothetical protein GVY16_07620 [Planctomycetes bacterium]|jgi:ribonuclease Z|nr:hypothetical protein [Phycisphaerae bacterium]NBB95595.1 hypothetical protein [Planctomycetota bacterium]
MNIRPYILSQMTVGELTIAGYSVAGEESVVIVPELDVCFDIGKCPREALPMNNVLLTHGHADHSAGLLYYFAQRDFQGMEQGTVVCPVRLIDPLEDLIHAWGRVEAQVPPYEFVGIADGQDYTIRRNLLARAFDTKHRHPAGAVGYAIVDVRHKIKPEYAGLAQQEIVDLKKQGREITNRTEIPLVAYLGDTAAANYSDLPYVRDAKVLLTECTFFEDDHRARARKGRHIHVDDMAALLEGMNNEKIIITHVTRRTNMGHARRALRRVLPKNVHERVTFLMNREHIEEA